MPFAIMRCVKLKSSSNLASSLQHNFRERETPNADESQTANNLHEYADNTDKAMGNWRERMPEKRRKDAVVAVEYLMTASPEWFAKASQNDVEAFFKACKDWIREKYGESNIIACSVHLDEKTPHMAMYVTPITADGRLSAKDFIGNRQKMSADQDSFHAAVAHLGLDRGIKGSKAKHKSIRQFYSEINAAQEGVIIKPQDVEPQVTKKGIFSTSYETPDAVAKRLNEIMRPMQEQAALFRDTARRLTTEKKAHERARNDANQLRRERDILKTEQKAAILIIDHLKPYLTKAQLEEAAEKAKKQGMQASRNSPDKSRGFSR